MNISGIASALSTGAPQAAKPPAPLPAPPSPGHAGKGAGAKGSAGLLDITA